MSYSPQLLEALMSPPQVGPLLPSLRYLSWQFRDPQDHPFVESLISCPKLIEVILWFSEEDNNDVSILSNLDHAAETLQSINVFAGSDSEVEIYLPLRSETLSSFQLLKRLQIWHDGEPEDISVASKVLALAARLPALEELYTFLPPVLDHTTYDSLGSDGHSTFPTLRVLRVDDSYGNASSLLQLLCRQALPLLNSLEMTINNIDDSSLATLATTIAKSCTPSNLASIEFSIWYSSRNVGSQIPLSVVLRPLLGFRNITSFQFGDSQRQVMDGVELKLLAVAWPSLRILSMTDMARHVLLPSGDQRKITMKELRDLLEKCPSYRARCNG